MSDEVSTKKIRSVNLHKIVEDPLGVLRGTKGPWPQTQERVLKLFLDNGEEPVLRGDLLAMFSGNRNPADKALQLLNMRLRKIGTKISGYQVYIVEPTEPENQLKLFK